jgi:RND family efflux transporter MFP subunit
VDLRPLKIERRDGAPAARAPAFRRRTSWLLRGAVALVVALGAWLFGGRLLEIADRVRLPEVEVSLVQRPSPLAASAVAGTAANGYVVARTRAALSADTPGRIVEMNVKEGDVVKKGFVVARLYAEEYRAALERAQAEVAAQHASIDRWTQEIAVASSEADRLAKAAAAARAAVSEAAATTKLAKLKLERAEKLFADGVESQQWLDDARAAHERATAAEESARAQLEAAETTVVEAGQRVRMQEAVVAEARARLPVLEAIRDEAKATLDKTEVRAPFDGVVVLKDAEVGEVVSPNSQGGNSRGSVATMVDFASLEVQVEMPERSIAAVAIGAPARIFLDAWPERPYAGRVARVWPVANRSKATIEVRVTFDRPDELLRPEMGARVVFLQGENEPAPESRAALEGVLVPAGAIVKVQGRSSLFVVERGRVRAVDVTAGEERSGRVLVTSGLSGQERVVVDPPARLADGDRVRVKGDA